MSSEVSLIITIVDKKLTNKLLKILREEHGITRKTLFLARGHSETDGEFFGMKIEPEREGILAVVPKEKEEEILHSLETVGDLNTPGRGIALSLDVNHIKGLL